MRSGDQRFMDAAMRLARASVGISSPNPPVGCVVVRRGQIIGRGNHDFGKLDHAEVVALREAGLRARGSTAYVTLEPCSHQGRTPPCAPLLASSGIRRAVVATEDPNPAVSGKGIAILRAAGVAVEIGIQRRQAQVLIEPFACRITTGSPLIVAKAGMTLDGRIGIPGRGRLRITSDESAKLTQQLRLRLDAILVGVGTVLEDDPDLTYRGTAAKRRPLIRAILDSRLRTPPGARLFDDASSPVILYCGGSVSARRRRVLEQQGAEVVPVPPGPGGLSIEHIVRDLGARDILGLLAEGGGAVHGSFVSLGMVDKFYFIVAPVLLGGRGAVPVVGGTRFHDIGSAARLRITGLHRAGEDLVIEAYPENSRSIISPWPRPGAPPFFARGRRPSSEPI